VTNELGIKVRDLERTMVHYGALSGWCSLHKDSMVIGKFGAKVDMQECQDVEVRHTWFEENVGWSEVEIVQVKGHVFVEGA
jgi:hypothetical protein